MEPFMHDYRAAVNRIKHLACFADGDNPLKIVSSEEHEQNETLFSLFMRIVGDLDMSEKEARYHYAAILDHAEHLKRMNGRSVGFHVAMCDYLVNIVRILECPKFMEFGKYEALLWQTTTDELTGLYNRRFFNEQLERELHRARRYGQPFSLLMIDIDDFKVINDNHGHPVGDAVLRELTRIMKAYLRSEDIAARYGGEEFVILLPHTDLEGARAFGERLLDKVMRHRFPRRLQVAFSGGIAGFPHHGRGAAALLKVADRSLYDAKLRGKGQISCSFDERRSASRYNADIQFQIHHPDGETHNADLRDISVTGLAGHAEGELFPGDKINVRLRDTSDRLVYLVEARVVWVKQEQRGSGDLDFGVKYTNRNPTLISHLITDYMSGK
jgi:diguanylate cyclase (GGDEF)-like protein